VVTLDPRPGWRPVDPEGDDGAPGPRWQAGGLPVDLHRSDVDGYRENLAASIPCLFVILGADPNAPIGVAPVQVTACPNEAQSYTADGEDRVEALAMPDAVRERLRAFVDSQPPATFRKRQRSPKHAAAGSDPFWRLAPTERQSRRGGTRQ